MDKPQCELALNYSGAGICKIIYVFRTSHTKFILNYINKYDNYLENRLKKFANLAWMKTRGVRLIFQSVKVVLGLFLHIT